MPGPLARKRTEWCVCPRFSMNVSGIWPYRELGEPCSRSAEPPNARKRTRDDWIPQGCRRDASTWNNLRRANRYPLDPFAQNRDRKGAASVGRTQLLAYYIENRPRRIAFEPVVHI